MFPIKTELKMRMAQKNISLKQIATELHLDYQILCRKMNGYAEMSKELEKEINDYINIK